MRASEGSKKSLKGTAWKSVGSQEIGTIRKRYGSMNWKPLENWQSTIEYATQVIRFILYITQSLNPWSLKKNALKERLIENSYSKYLVRMPKQTRTFIFCVQIQFNFLRGLFTLVRGLMSAYLLKR